MSRCVRMKISQHESHISTSEYSSPHNFRAKDIYPRILIHKLYITGSNKQNIEPQAPHCCPPARRAHLLPLLFAQLPTFFHDRQRLSRAPEYGYSLPRRGDKDLGRNPLVRATPYSQQCKRAMSNCAPVLGLEAVETRRSSETRSRVSRDVLGTRRRRRRGDTRVRRRRRCG
jgi:hypothetical protein